MMAADPVAEKRDARISVCAGAKREEGGGAEKWARVPLAARLRTNVAPPPTQTPSSFRRARATTMDAVLFLHADTLMEDDDISLNAHLVSLLLAQCRRRRRLAHARRLPRYFGSLPGRRANCPQDFELGFFSIVRYYSGVHGRPPVFGEAEFERRFRVPRCVFIRIFRAVNDHPCFVQRVNATGRPTGSTATKNCGSLAANLVRRDI